jgi:hypothetical protein
MKKSEILKIVQESAVLYKNNLLGKKIVFIYKNGGKINFYKAKFEKNNFLHLTGLVTKFSPDQFFDNIIDKKININDINENKKGTARLKIVVLKQLMSITRISKMTGDYNCSKVYLYTEKLTGNTRACMGFVKGKNKNGTFDEYYYPNTCLNENTKNVIQGTKRILLIIEEDTNKILYTAKKIDSNEILNSIKFK